MSIPPAFSGNCVFMILNFFDVAHSTRVSPLSFHWPKPKPPVTLSDVLKDIRKIVHPVYWHGMLEGYWRGYQKRKCWQCGSDEMRGITNFDTRQMALPP